jgi:hypothetical protein
VPTFIDDYDKRLTYATEEQMLEFANVVRAAGGANALEAFFPSEPENPKACLIANALNFKTSVQPLWSREHYSWMMVFPKNMAKAKVEAIAKAIQSLGYDDVSYAFDHLVDGEQRKIIRLPKVIGNTADAFDNATRGWVTKYRIKEESNG